MNNMLVGFISVIIPVYNCELYLERCLNSVLNQTYSKLEVILIDDGSTDNSGKICDAWAQKDCRIIVRHTKNNGVSTARNIGLNLSQGEYISFIDSDDWIDNDMYTVQIDVMQKHDIDICVSGYVLSTNSTSCNAFKTADCRVYNREDALMEIFSYKSQQYMDWILCDKLFKRSIISHVRFKRECTFGEDKLLFWNIMKNVHQIYYFPLNKYHYFMREDSAIHTNNIRHILDDILVSETIYKEACVEKKVIYELMAIRYYMTIISSIRRIMLLYKQSKEEIILVNKYSNIIRKNLFYILSKKISYIYILGVIYVCLPYSVKKLFKIIIKNIKRKADDY